MQIHEVGEAGGHPYCAWSSSKAATLPASSAATRCRPAKRPELAVTLARAMQLVHSRNVVHRDLEAGQCAAGSRRHAPDHRLRLARQLDSDSGETQAGAVMGTPSYMAPEQASGRGHEAGPAADVYALGAILYDCLAGRPPFQGNTVVETLDQVRTQEPVPPSRWQASVPLDLETVCLKCLRKEPENRYASAAELADELGRFLRGEPVQARPVGRLERGWRWCKRYPALALAAATVVGVLVAASVISTLFGIDAHNKETAAVEARNDLESGTGHKEEHELEQSQDQLEGALARTWLSPLADARPFDRCGNRRVHRGGGFRQRTPGGAFRDGGLSSRQGMRKLQARSAFALHAVVGLDARKRQEVERRLVRAWKGPTCRTKRGPTWR